MSAIRFGKNFPEPLQGYPRLRRWSRRKKVPGWLPGMRVLLELCYDRSGTSPRVSEEQRDILRETQRRVDGGQLRASYRCPLCNSFKGSDIAGRDPRTRKLTSLFNPRRHKWARHFRWQGAYLIGRTAIGRVTVAVLNINDPFRLELRGCLIEEGLFPPA